MARARVAEAAPRSGLRAPCRLRPPASLTRSSVVVKGCRYLCHGSSPSVRQTSSGHNDCTDGRGLTRALRVGPRRVPPIALVSTRTTAVASLSERPPFAKRTTHKALTTARNSSPCHPGMRSCRSLAETRQSCPRRTTFRRFAAKGLSRISLPCRSDYVSTFRGDECRSASRCPVRAGLRFYVSRRRPWGRGHVWWWWEASAWSQLAGLGLSRRQLLSGKKTDLGVAPLRTITDQIARKVTKSCAGACHPARSAERIKARSPVSRNWAELRDALGRQRP